MELEVRTTYAPPSGERNQLVGGCATGIDETRRQFKTPAQTLHIISGQLTRFNLVRVGRPHQRQQRRTALVIDFAFSIERYNKSIQLNAPRKCVTVLLIEYHFNIIEFIRMCFDVNSVGGCVEAHFQLRAAN